ncbi:siderophore-interacting protein [Kocuria rhizophila]|nr:siderophore-interacting protein [Kocuria rhizophila]
MTCAGWTCPRPHCGIDAALHGGEGHAGPRAASARPGDRIVARGPAGSAFGPRRLWSIFAGGRRRRSPALANLQPGRAPRAVRRSS